MKISWKWPLFLTAAAVAFAVMAPRGCSGQASPPVRSKKSAVVRTLQLQLEESRRHRAQISDELSRLQDEMTRMRQEREELAQKLQDSTPAPAPVPADASRIKSDPASAKNASREFDRALKERTDKFQSLQAKFDKLQGQAEADEKKAKESEQSLKAKEKELQKAKAVALEAQRARDLLKTQLEQAAGAGEKLRDESRSMLQRLESVRKQMTALQAANEEWQKRVAVLESDLSKKEDELEQAFRAQKTIAGEREGLDRELKRARNDLARAQQSRKQSEADQREQERTKRELAEANERIAELIVTVDAMESKAGP
ncbi:MAG: hypothetical protein HY594_00085 [Candidatus Omnitrophica bacterium]|nr:hypothetical protein [Candidatus Omnitrophota bacterium]